MISSCPLLEELTLKEIDGLTQINIHAPNLKCLDILCEFESINFDDTLQLALVSVILFSKSNQIGLHGCSSIVPVKLPTPCINLKIFRVSINFNDLKKILAVLCLLNSSPNLRILNLYGHNEKENDLLMPVSCCWEDIFSEPSMPLGVQHMMIDGISGTKSELDFIQFLLLYSPDLEKMFVKPIANVRTEVMTKLIRFKRASRQAEVIDYGELPKDFDYPQFEF
ncbi:ubiquitin-protein ligase, putative [Medicago truncatula]|uniref:Ubiquitin-protein ligase, putative n=1 Tax=Medicago truncatula TaxID=3880 RepID=G7I7L4_MEDTR|nr:ubiquitin-protein ligase, putative [Medicago truncatula]